MPVIICSWCHYVASGNTLEDKWEDTLRHEKEQHRNEDDFKGSEANLSE